MSLIAVTVVFGGNTTFTQEMPASDGKQEWVNSDFIKDMRQNEGTLNTGGAIFRYHPEGNAFDVEYRVTERPTDIAPSDLG